MNDRAPDRLIEIMNLWVALTEKDQFARSLSIEGYSVRTMHDEVHEALKLDPSDATAYLLLDAFFESYFRQRVFTAADLIDDSVSIESYLDRTRRLRALLRADDIVEIGDRFTAKVRAAIAQYDVPESKIGPLFKDRFNLAFLRRDTLRSMEHLRVDQFLRGEPEPEGVTPQYAKVVHQYWNVNSLLKAACNMPSGVSINLIRDPDAYQSYFVFAIRNGGNLFLLSDVPVFGHPLGRYMTRRPERHLDERAGQNWFPYDLLGLRYDEETGEPYIEQVKQTGLVPYQSVAFPLKPIRDLAAAEIVWIALMFDQIVARFWRNGIALPELSYTGEMVRERHKLALAAQGAHLPVHTYREIEAPALTVADLRSGAVDASALGREGTTSSDHNRWLEERYAGSVKDEVLNLVGIDVQRHTLTSNAGKDGVVSLKVDVRDKHEEPPRTARVELRALDATSFGSKEQLLGDRVFIARFNLATNLQLLADREYAQRRDEVAAWFRARLETNLPVLLSYATSGSLRRPVPEGVKQGGFHPALGGYNRKQPEGYNILRVIDLRVDQDRSWNSVWLPSPRRADHGPRCVLTDAKPSYRLQFIPEFASDLCILTGCASVSDLPDVLRHWRREPPYIGNSNLNRIDPLGWHLKDPWRGMTTAVSLFLSARAMNKLRKEASSTAAGPVTA